MEDGIFVSDREGDFNARGEAPHPSFFEFQGLALCYTAPGVRDVACSLRVRLADWPSLGSLALSLSLSLSLCLRCIICTAMACDVLGGRRLCSGRRPDRFRPTWCAERACRILLWCGPPRQRLSWRTFALREVVSLVPVRPQMAVAARPAIKTAIPESQLPVAATCLLL